MAGPTGGGSVSTPAAAVDPDAVPAWARVSSDTLESAARDSKPLVIFFAGEEETQSSFTDKELAEISKEDAVFIFVAYNPDRDKSPWAEETAVPTSKILSDNPSRDYGIAVGKMTVVVSDSYGNEYTRLAKQPKATELKGYLGKIKASFDKIDEKLQKNLEKANEALAANDRKSALKLLLKNFGEDVVGLTAQEDSIRAYHEILDAGRTQMGELAEKADVAGLKALEKEFAKTDLEKEIEAAIKDLK